MATRWAFVSLVIVLVHSVEPNPCTGGGVTLTGAGSGVVSSPGFPGNFPQNSLCIWNITVPSGRIKLTFLNFTLEPGEKPCRQGGQGARLKITNVASNDNENPFALCGPLTPGQLPAPVYSIANYLGLQLSTLNNVYSGFKATYETVTDDMLCPSASNLTAQSGDITSPYYPRNYPSSQNCFWEITASKGKRVKLEVKDMEIRVCGPSCTCGYLEVLDGFIAPGGQASGKKCFDGNNFSPLTYYSTDECLRVRFYSFPNISKQERGFTATYTQLNFTPPECPTAPIPLSGNGTFSSLNYPVDKYPPSKNCFWIITAPIGKHVKVTIKDFRMGNCDNANLCQTPDSICSYLEFRDGPSAESSFLGRLCKGSVLSAKVSSGHQIFVKFHAGFSLDYGFQAEYSESLDEPTPTQTRPTTPTTPHITPKPPTESLDETTPTQTRRPTTTTTSTAPTTPHTTPKPPTTGAAVMSITVLLVILPSFAASMLWP